MSTREKILVVLSSVGIALLLILAGVSAILTIGMVGSGNNTDGNGWLWTLLVIGALFAIAALSYMLWRYIQSHKVNSHLKKQEE